MTCDLNNLGELGLEIYKNLPRHEKYNVDMSGLYTSDNGVELAKAIRACKDEVDK